MRSLRRAEAFERHYPDAYRFAFHLSGDARKAENAVIRAFGRCFSRFEHLRDSVVFDSAVLNETWRAAVPAGERGALAPAAASILDRLGIDPAVLPVAERHGEETWARPGEEQELPAVDALPSETSYREAVSLSRRRRAGVLVSLLLVAAGVAWGVTREDGSSRPQVQRGRLPEILPQAYEPRGPKVELVVGSLENKPWSVNAYKAEHRSVCIELRVDDTYGDVHCPSDFKTPLRAFVGPDGAHRTTFIYGYARSDVTDIAVKVKGSPPVGVEIGRDAEALGFEEPGGFFAITVPGYLLPLTNESQGERLGYKVFKLRITASGQDGERLGKQRLFLGRPT